MRVTWRDVVLALASEACLDLDRLVKLALAVNRFGAGLEPAQPLLDDSHYEVTWRGFWSDRVERLVRELAARGDLVAGDGGCYRARRRLAVVNGLRERVESAVALLGPLTLREIDLEIARGLEKCIGVPVLLDHVVGARLGDLAPTSCPA